MRTRVMAAGLVVAALGMTLAGVTSYLLQRQRIDTRIDDALAQEVSEFRAFARSGVDPRTGAPFTTVEGLFFIALQRNVPDMHEGLLAMIDGEVALVPSAEIDLRPHDDEQFVELLRAVPVNASVRVQTADAGCTTWRSQSGRWRSGAGVYVVAYARDREQAVLLKGYRTYTMVCILALTVVGAVGFVVAGRLRSAPVGL